MDYAISTIVELPYDTVLERTRTTLADQGFGVLTEIDVQATTKAKLDADVPPHLILGACRPPLALAALRVEPSIGLLLPCNVVVRALNARLTAVEVIDPQTMVSVTGNAELQRVALEAAERLRAALNDLTTGSDC